MTLIHNEKSVYDTQGKLYAKNMGYSFRERIENGTKEVTLKYRGGETTILLT